MESQKWHDNNRKRSSVRDGGLRIGSLRLGFGVQGSTVRV